MHTKPEIKQHCCELSVEYFKVKRLFSIFIYEKYFKPIMDALWVSHGCVMDASWVIPYSSNLPYKMNPFKRILFLNKVLIIYLFLMTSSNEQHHPFFRYFFRRKTFGKTLINYTALISFQILLLL